MYTKNVLIVEDEEYSMNMLEKLINETTPFVKCFRASTIEQAYMILHKELIDAFFIDIILNSKRPDDASGMNLAEELRGIDKYRFTPIIFITSVEDSKLYAYKRLHCYDYIEKPYLVKEVKHTLIQALHYKTQPEAERIVHFKKDGILVSIIENDIIYMKSIVRSLYIYTKYEEISIPYKTCTNMLQLLDNRIFVQCNRNTIVNRKCIGYIDKVNRYLELKNCITCDKLNIGRKYLDKILEGITIW